MFPDQLETDEELLPDSADCTPSLYVLLFDCWQFIIAALRGHSSPILAVLWYFAGPGGAPSSVHPILFVRHPVRLKGARITSEIYYNQPHGDLTSGRVEAKMMRNIYRPGTRPLGPQC